MFKRWWLRWSMTESRLMQAMYDDPKFFEYFKQLRHRADCYNNAMEQPAISALLPNVAQAAVLDAGCGLGFNCMQFAQMGAGRVLGIDTSKRMLKAARAENSHHNIEYRLMGLEDIGGLRGSEVFDLVYSSLAAHYAKDFGAFVRGARDVLAEGGVLLFSQEHPMTTAPIDGPPRWLKDDAGVKIASVISDYLTEGLRSVSWAGATDVKYHRSFSTIINTLTGNGFAIMQIAEPAPTADVLAAAPQMYDETHRPTAIIVKARRGYV